MPSVEERFWAKVDKTGECWLWTGYLMKDGYGRFGLEKKKVLAHRLSLQWSLGRPIGEGLVCRHKCRNRHCVRPEHLDEGTVAENVNDKIRDGTNIGPRGTKQHTCKLSEEQVRTIRADQRLQREIATEYGINQKTVSDIKAGKRWGWL